MQNDRVAEATELVPSQHLLEIQTMQIKLNCGQYYGTIRMNRSIPGFHVMEIVYPPGLKLPTHSHESACFGLMLHGAMSENYGTKALESRGGTVGFNAANEEHSNTISTAGAHFLILEVETELTERTLNRASSVVHSAIFSGGEVNWLATKLLREWTQFDSVSPLAIEGLGLELIAAVRRTSTPQQIMPPVWLQRAQDLIHARFTEGISLSYIASELGVHRVNLARSFRQYYQSSIADYVRNLRIELVQRHLGSTALPLAEIAARAGFYDQAHMTRLFKRATGLTPARYRALRSR